jgi:hypothetical protein
MIGIKVADGDFFPIAAENINAKKRLVLTTAHDNQPSVQIDFYKSSLLSMKDAVYIGTLMLENISKKERGGPSIELIVSSNENGEFSASAYDLEKPDENGKHILAGSLLPLENSESFNDINLDNEGTVIKDRFLNEYGAAVKPSKSKLLMIAIPALAIIIFGLYFFVFRAGLNKTESVNTVPPAEITYKAPPPPEVAVAPAEEAPPPPVIKAPESPEPRKRDPAPVSFYNTPDAIPADGLTYTLRWGDTLWDVSQAFYRTPWRYNYLARYNGIRNADRIIAGRTIMVPPMPK